MDPLLTRLLLAWQWRPWLLLGLLVLGLLYTIGWRRLRERSGDSGRRRLGAAWRPLAYWTGLAVVALALFSPIDTLGEHLFAAHMVQHILLVMIAPPLLLLADPLPFLIWGVPVALRRPAGALLARRSLVQRGLRKLTPLGVSWLIFVAAYLGWHDPDLYSRALALPWLHDLEHLSFFGAAMLVWWPIAGSAPHWHGRLSRLVRAVFALALVPPNMIAGMFIALASAPIYTHYTTVPRLLGTSVLQDQQWGGYIMWAPGSMMFIIAGLVLLYRQFQREEGRGPLDERARLLDDVEAPWAAPGVER